MEYLDSCMDTTRKSKLTASSKPVPYVSIDLMLKEEDAINPDTSRSHSSFSLCDEKTQSSITQVPSIIHGPEKCKKITDYKATSTFACSPHILNKQ